MQFLIQVANGFCFFVGGILAALVMRVLFHIEQKFFGPSESMGELKKLGGSLFKFPDR